MRWVASLVLPLVLLAGCSASIKVDRLAADLSGQDPVLQVWCKGKHLDDGANMRVLVGWNKWLGTGTLEVSQTLNDGTIVAQVADWKPNGSDWDKFNEMRIEVLYNDQLNSKRVLKTPNEFGNAMMEKKFKK